MPRSSTSVPRVAPWLVLAHAMAGCAPASHDARDPVPATASAVTSPPASTTPAPPHETAEPSPPPEDPAPPPAGWRRLALSSVVPELHGTIDVPEGLAVEATSAQDNDADGLSVDAPGVAIGPRLGGLELATMTTIAPRFESAAAMARFHGQFELVSTHEFGPGHWAVVQQWRPGECMLHGWSAPAGLVCDVFQAPCGEMAQWVQVCSTLRPGPTPNTAQTTLASAFPSMEPAAAEVAMTVARSVARNDASMLLGAVGPAGLRIGRKKHTAESLAAALAAAPVVQVVAPRQFAPGEPTEGMLAWNSGSPTATRVRVWFTTGYGVQPYFELSKTGDDWHVVEFGTHDLGDP